MKNILARGGIEFLAVLLGITGSFIIDDKKNERELIKHINSSLHALRGELLTNIKELESFNENIPKLLPRLDIVIKADSLKYLSVRELDLYYQNSTTNWGSKLNYRVFDSIEASGLIYKIGNDSLRNNILNLYQSIYDRYHYILDYDLTHIQKFDDIILSSDFELRDDPSNWQWAMDWSNGSNIKQFEENKHFRNFLIANRANKRLLKRFIPSVFRETNKTIQLISNYLNDTSLE